MNDTELTNRLPFAVNERLQTFRDIAKERSSALIEMSAQMRSARSELEADSERLRRLEAEGRDKSRIQQLRTTIERGESALAKIITRVDKLGASWKAAHELTGNLEQYVREHLAGVVALYEGDVPQLRSGEKAVDGLARAARRTRSLKADRIEILSAPYPSSYAKQVAREQIAARVAAARPDVTAAIDHGGLIKFPMTDASIDQSAAGGGRLYAVDAVALLAWAFPAEFQAAIDREIDAFADDPVALSEEQRTEKLAVIEADLFTSEREEAAFAELAGLLPRADLDPRAALGLADTMPAPRRD